VILVRYPFTDLTGSKIRPAVVVSSPHESSDIIFVPLTSRTAGLRSGEFLLSDFHGAGLNVPTAVKRGLHAIDERLVLKSVGTLKTPDTEELDQSLAYWLGLPSKSN
jgi:mRNA interferase MazF